MKLITVVILSLLLLACQGPAGPQGEQGIQGPVGERGAPGPAGAGASVDALVADVKDAVVCVTVRDAVDWYHCATGFYVDAAGTVMTSAHTVITDQIDVREIAVRDQQGRTVEYRVVGESPHIDAAFLSPVSPLNVETPFLTASSRAPKQGEAVTVMGYPINSFFWDQFLVTTGVLSATNRADNTNAIGVVEGAEYHALDVYSDIGSSGGPVFAGGALVGMLTHSGFYLDEYGDIDGLSYAISLVGESLSDS